MEHVGISFVSGRTVLCVRELVFSEARQQCSRAVSVPACCIMLVTEDSKEALDSEPIWTLGTWGTAVVLGDRLEDFRKKVRGNSDVC